jgi:hypothetical protein
MNTAFGTDLAITGLEVSFTSDAGGNVQGD